MQTIFFPQTSHTKLVFCWGEEGRGRGNGIPDHIQIFRATSDHNSIAWEFKIPQTKVCKNMSNRLTQDRNHIFYVDKKNQLDVNFLYSLFLF